MAAALRSGRISAEQRNEGRRHLDRLWEEIDHVDLGMELARRAGDLAERHGLRAYDAVHLASVETVADRETVLVAGDGRLLDAAADLGVMVAPIRS